MASRAQSKEIELKLGRANDALENGNHDEYSLFHSHLKRPQDRPRTRLMSKLCLQDRPRTRLIAKFKSQDRPRTGLVVKSQHQDGPWTRLINSRS